MVKRLYEHVFLPGHALFAERHQPERAADWLVDHSDPARPIVLRRANASPASRER